eukprot:TRINITY_DN4913_c0_g2_i2.p2 TRINITY_DN4913_c0_g2~~TRINITY_DN4913_c0_g2_i2.p2  ORF type:complete len:175 (-),score=24.71 TRINITY_DN4913_c0_g2_i2:361-861(-)
MGKLKQDYQQPSDRNAQLEEEVIILRQSSDKTSADNATSGNGGSVAPSAVEAANNVGMKKQVIELTQKLEHVHALAMSISHLRIKLNKEAQRSWVTSKRSPWGKIMQEVNNISQESKNLRGGHIIGEGGKKVGVKGHEDQTVAWELVELLDFGVESLKQFVQRFCT